MAFPGVKCLTVMFGFFVLQVLQVADGLNDNKFILQISTPYTEIDQDANKAKIGDVIFLYIGEEETKLPTTIVIFDSESDDYLVRNFFLFTQHPKGLEFLHVYRDRNRVSTCIFCMFIRIFFTTQLL